MSTILIALLLLLSIALIISMLVFINKRNETGKRKKIFMQLSQLGSANGLSFTSQEILGKKMLALDGINRKLVMIEEAGDGFSTAIISLDEVESCVVKKSHSTVIDENSKPPHKELLLNEILLQFKFKNGREAFTVIFYDFNTNSIYQSAALETKANDWEILLSKLIKKQVLQRV